MIPLLIGAAAAIIIVDSLMDENIRIKKLSDPGKLFGTSFHGDTIKTTIQGLTKKFGDGSVGGEKDKIQYQWALELNDGTPFTIYDWKEYRKLKKDETLEFNIGGPNERGTRKARMAIEDYINKC